MIDVCLAIPAKVLSINPEDNKAQVDFGDGTVRTVNVSLVKAKTGQYVIVHAGFAIQVMDVKEAQETLELWKEILSKT